MDIKSQFRNSFSRHRLKIKEEIPTENSQDASCSLSRSEDLSLPSTSSDKVKQEAFSKMSVLKKSLLLNTQIRTTLEVETRNLKAALKNNLEKQKAIEKIFKDESFAKPSVEKPSQIRAISVFAAPYFRDVRRMVPPINEDTKMKRKNCDVNAYLKPPRPWSQAENKKLLDGVTGFALISALKPYKIKRDFLKKRLKGDLTEFEIETIQRNLDAAENKIKIVSQKPLNDLLLDIRGKIDWMAISSVNLEGTRTPEECENMWNNFLDFSINKEPFTEAEDEKLKNLAEDNHEKDWDSIATSLRTCRTAVQCFERYQSRLNGNLKRRYWTKEEDDRLLALIDEHKCGEIIPWNKVSLSMDGRTRQQCINRYERSISQICNRGPWTVEQDALLIACYHKFETHWHKMKDFFRKRSTCAIRERYVNALDPSLKTGAFTRDEDRQLINMIRRYGWGKWAKICKKLPGRTDNMCLVRAGRLLEYSVKYHSDKGTGEYDPGINDPEMFAKILRPLASSVNGANRNYKLRRYRENAIITLLEVLKKIVPNFNADENDLNSIDFSWLSSETLYQISEELYNRKHEREKKAPYVPQLKYYKRNRLRKRWEFDSDEESLQPSPEKELPYHEIKFIDSVLGSMFDVRSNVMQPADRRVPIDYNRRETVELQLYQAYLFQQYGCLNVCEDTHMDTTFGGIDYSETLQTVASYFVQPPTYENQFIVLAPNLTTIGAMEVMEATENRLLSMSDCVSHSKNYIDFLCNRRKSCPKCLKCLSKVKKQVISEVTPESVMSNMENKHYYYWKCYISNWNEIELFNVAFHVFVCKGPKMGDLAPSDNTLSLPCEIRFCYKVMKKLFIVTENMEASANIESGSTSKCLEQCSCDSLKKSETSVQLLRKRFMSLFLWPTLLAATDMNKSQEDMLCCHYSGHNRPKNYYNTSQSEPSVRKKRCKREPKAKPGGEIDAGVKRTLKRKEHNPPELRRSKRSCVLNRTTYSFTKNSKKNLIAKENGRVVPESIGDARIQSGSVVIKVEPESGGTS